MIIAFMGNDGSGKTTIIHLLRKRLVQEGRKVIYIPGYDHLFLDQFKRLYQKLTGANSDKLHRLYDDISKPKANKLFYLWPYFVFVDCLCLWIRYRLKFRKIVLFDRYFYDYVVSFQHLRVKTWLEEFLFLRLPRPKNSFIIDVSAQIAYHRKKDTHKGRLDYYKKQRTRYLWLAKKKNILVINTDKTTPEEIARKIYSRLFIKREKARMS